MRTSQTLADRCKAVEGLRRVQELDVAAFSSGVQHAHGVLTNAYCPAISTRPSLVVSVCVPGRPCWQCTRSDNSNTSRQLNPLTNFEEAQRTRQPSPLLDKNEAFALRALHTVGSAMLFVRLASRSPRICCQAPLQNVRARYHVLLALLTLTCSATACKRPSPYIIESASQGWHLSDARYALMLGLSLIALKKALQTGASMLS